MWILNFPDLPSRSIFTIITPTNPQVSVHSSKVRILPKSQEVWILKFPEVPSRTAAEQMLGYRLIIPAAQRERLKVRVRGHCTYEHL